MMKLNVILFGALIALIPFATADVSETRVRRGIPGGVNQLSSAELAEEQENLSKSLAKLDTGDGPSYTIAKVHSGTRQVVAGSLTKLDCDLIDSKSGKTERCVVSLWSQPWLKEDGYEVSFECKNKPKSVHRHSRSVGLGAPVLGGENKLSPSDLKEEEKSLSESLSKLAAGEGPSYTIDKCHSGTKQTVAGTLTKLDCDLVLGESGKKERCVVSLWSRAWLKKDGYEVSFECGDKPKSVHRHSRSVEERPRRGLIGGPKQLDASELKEEEQSLTKSLTKLANGDGPSYTIDTCHSGTRQVVSGTKTILDCDLIDGKTGNKERCVVSLWSQPWLKQDGYQVTFECKDKPKSVHRHSRSTHEDKKSPSTGGTHPLSADEIKEQEEIFSKALKKLAAGEGPSYSLSKITRGTKQVVSGTIVNVQAELVNGKTGAQTKCNMKLWSQPWEENGYELSFNCQDKHKSVNRFSL